MAYFLHFSDTVFKIIQWTERQKHHIIKAKRRKCSLNLAAVQNRISHYFSTSLPSSLAEDTGVESWSIRLETGRADLFVVVFLGQLKRMPGKYRIMYHHRFLPRPAKFIEHDRPRREIVTALDTA